MEGSEKQRTAAQLEQMQAQLHDLQTRNDSGVVAGLGKGKMKVLVVVTYTKELEVEVPETNLEDRDSEEYKKMVSRLSEKADEMSADPDVPLRWVSTSYSAKQGAGSEDLDEFDYIS